jgi:serine carboxypeptidase-like clade II
MSLCASGDMDAVCSFISTQYVLDNLGLPVEASWRPWRIDNEVHGPLFIR